MARVTQQAVVHGKYEKPRIVDLGTLQGLTAGGNPGDKHDKTFPVSTPPSQLAFS